MRVLSAVLLALLLPQLAAASGCMAGGCSGELCVDDAIRVASPCLFKPEYACYRQHAVCERQSNGECGWTDTPALKDCLKKAAMQPSPVPIPRVAQ